MRIKRRKLLKSSMLRMGLTVFFVHFVSISGAAMLVQTFMWQNYQVSRQSQAMGLRDTLIAEYEANGLDRLNATISKRAVTDRLFDVGMLVVAEDGRILAGNLATWPEGVTSTQKWNSAYALKSDGVSRRYMVFTTTKLKAGVILITGTFTTSPAEVRSSYFQVLILSVLIAVPLALIVAWFATRRVNYRLRSIVAVTSEVTKGQLSSRVVLNGSGDAFDELGLALNFGLDRVETLVGELRIVTQGLAHDLRSPTSRLKLTIERARGLVTDPAAQAALEKVSNEVNILLSLLAASLQISSAKAGFDESRREPEDMAVLARDLVEIYEPVAEQSGLALSAVAPETLIASVSKELISQVLSNLVENAIKYARGGSKIEIEVKAIANGVEISVSDDGTGIAADQIPLARKRYGRLETSRGQTGSGLGLPLVETVVRLHQGQIAYLDNQPGLRVVITLPQSLVMARL